MSNDPYDYSRGEAQHHASRAAVYAGTVVEMIAVGDDIAAIHAIGHLILETRMAATAMKLVQGRLQPKEVAT